MHEFNLDDISLVRGHTQAGWALLLSVCCTAVPYLVPSLSGGKLTIRTLLVFVALFCAAKPLEKTKCELVHSLCAVSISFLSQFLPLPGLLLLSGGKDHLSKGQFTAFLDILAQIFTAIQEVFPAEDSEHLWALGVAHRDVRELV